jgi:hypothetical protein
MQTSLNLGKIDIYDAEVASFIQNKSVEEIKSLFINLLKTDVSTKQSLDSLNKNLKPIRNIDIDEEKNKYLKEKFYL